MEILKPCFLYVTGNVGRFKNRGKSHSERARTPGRQTPGRASPADDIARSWEGSPERSPTEDAHHNSLSAADRNVQPHNSPDGTLVDTIVSEATIKQGKKSKSENSERKNKSKGSKASSPARSMAEEQVQQQPQQGLVVEQEVNGEKSRSPSPRLRVKRSKSPPLSQRTSRGEGDDPSFANTLDDVATMGTNEVADQDLSSHYTDDRPQTADLPVEPHEDIPAINFVRPTTPEEEMTDEPKTIAAEPPIVKIVEPPPIETKIKPEPIVAEDTGQVGGVLQKPTAKEPLYEPSYETVEEPAKLEAPVVVDEVVDTTAKINSSPNKQAQADNQTVTTGVTLEELKTEKLEEGGEEEPLPPDFKLKQALILDIKGEVARSASSGSSLGLNSPLDPDRQYTPLSFSSSDAQFYSPPDSPDISLSEQLGEKAAHHLGHTQVTHTHFLSTLKYSQLFPAVGSPGPAPFVMFD